MSLTKPLAWYQEPRTEQSPQSLDITLPLCPSCPCMWGNSSAGAPEFYHELILRAVARCRFARFLSPSATAPSYPDSLIIYFSKAHFLHEKFQWNILTHNVSSSWCLELKEPLSSKSKPLIFKMKRRSTAIWGLAQGHRSSHGRKLHLGLRAPRPGTPRLWLGHHGKPRRNLRGWFLTSRGSFPLLIDSQKKISILKKQEQLRSQSPSPLWLFKASCVHSPRSSVLTGKAYNSSITSEHTSAPDEYWLTASDN